MKESKSYGRKRNDLPEVTTNNGVVTVVVGSGQKVVLRGRGLANQRTSHRALRASGRRVKSHKVFVSETIDPLKDSNLSVDELAYTKKLLSELNESNSKTKLIVDKTISNLKYIFLEIKELREKANGTG